jgi:hypothetical protein
LKPATNFHTKGWPFRAPRFTGPNINGGITGAFAKIEQWYVGKSATFLNIEFTLGQESPVWQFNEGIHHFSTLQETDRPNAAATKTTAA